MINLFQIVFNITTCIYHALNIFKDIDVWMNRNTGMLLFVGTGCQCEAIRKYSEIKKCRDRLLIVDIVCHGVPSPKLWKEYVGGQNDYLSFKDKRHGWKNPYAFIVKNGREETIYDYESIYYGDWTLRPSCYECKFSVVERKTDITIGDFWGIDKLMPDFFTNEGTSLVLIHSDRGQNIWNQIKDKLDYRESNAVDCVQPNLLHPTEKPRLRDKFWDDYNIGGIKRVLN